MTDYNTYLDGLMAACRKSVQSPPSWPQYPHVSPLPNPPFRISLKKPQHRPVVSTDRPAVEAADTSSKIQHAAAASRSDVHENLPPALNAPRSNVFTDRPAVETAETADTSGKLQHAAIASQSDVHENLSPAQDAPRSGIFTERPAIEAADTISKVHHAVTASRPDAPKNPPPALNAPRSSISTDRPAVKTVETVDTSGKVQHAATASRPDVPKNLPPALNAPRPRVYRTLLPPTATPHADVDRIVPPPPAYAPHSAVPRKLLPEATAPPPFAPIFQLPTENLTSAHGPQKANEPVTPTCHIEPKNTKSGDHMKDKPDKTSLLRYKNMPQTVMSEELKRRGLKSGGPNLDLVKRLEQDDAFQATPRTAENYDTMDPKYIQSLCVTRSISSQGETSVLRDRLKAHDKREYKKKPTVSRRTACDDCQKRKRRCIHGIYGEEDPVLANEPAIPRPTARKGYRKDKDGFMCKEPALDTEIVAPQSITNLRLSHPRESSSWNDEKPSLAVEALVGRRVTRTRMSNPKAAASGDELRRPADNGRVTKGVERKTNGSNVRRKPVMFQPKDEISLLQICVKLKEVIAWGKISGFWYMVQDTLQLKTGKDYRKVSRHVEMLVGKRRAEQREFEQRGKISRSRVSAGCRPLLDKWIAGGKQEHQSSPKTSKKPVIREEEDKRLGEVRSQQPDLNDSALEVQKRSATDAWLDSSCDTTRSKKVKLCTSELTSVPSTSHADSIGCWSLSGSSVTSESSLEDEDEDEDEDDMKSGKY